MPSAIWLRFYKMPFAKVYPAYIAKVERKVRGPLSCLPVALESADRMLADAPKAEAGA